jgi:hypothetical protein
MARPQKPDALPCLASTNNSTHMTHMSFLACLAFAAAWQHDGMIIQFWYYC